MPEVEGAQHFWSRGGVGKAVRTTNGASYRIQQEPPSATPSPSARVGTAMPCVEVETLAALVAGMLPDEELADVEAHLARCELCRSVVADAARGAMASTGNR